MIRATSAETPGFRRAGGIGASLRIDANTTADIASASIMAIKSAGMTIGEIRGRSKPTHEKQDDDDDQDDANDTHATVTKAVAVATEAAAEATKQKNDEDDNEDES